MLDLGLLARKSSPPRGRPGEHSARRSGIFLVALALARCPDREGLAVFKDLFHRRDAPRIDRGSQHEPFDRTAGAQRGAARRQRHPGFPW
jgi:hypothetical protein